MNTDRSDRLQWLRDWFAGVIILMGLFLTVRDMVNWHWWLIAGLALTVLLYTVLLRPIQSSYRRWRQRGGEMPSLLDPFQAGLHSSMVSDPDVAPFRSSSIGALLLLLMDGLESGMWGRGYLLRQRLDGKLDNIAAGTLTGTYFSICALAGYLGAEHLSRLYPLTDQLRQHLRPLVSPTNGTYIRNYEYQGTPRVRITHPESPRHTAGGLLLRLLIQDTDERDQLTLQRLGETLSHPQTSDPFDIAFALRAVLAFHYQAPESGCLHQANLHKAYVNGVRWLASASSEADVRMIWAPKADTHPSLDSGRIGSPIYQWTVVWALLPIIQDTVFCPRKYRVALQKCILHLVAGQLSVQGEHNSLFADRWGLEQGKAPGESLYGTCVAFTALSSLTDCSDFQFFSKRFEEVRNRITGVDVARLCSVAMSNEEGYLAFAATLMASVALRGPTDPKHLGVAESLLAGWHQKRSAASDATGLVHSFQQVLATCVGEHTFPLNARELHDIAELAAQRETQFQEHYATVSSENTSC